MIWRQMERTESVTRRLDFVKALTLLGAWLCVLGVGALCGQTAPGPPDDSSAQIMIEVTNRHFTVGEKLPSVYLRVFFDRTADCQLRNHYGKGTDVVQKKVLMSSEFEAMKALVDQPELRKIDKRYGLTHPVFDSWMEWDIKVQHSEGEQEITVANFSPESTRGPSQPYPDALVMLGCSISKLRNDVCSDEPDWRSRNCGKVLQGK
jgi:hypothetical protein